MSEHTTPDIDEVIIGAIELHNLRAERDSWQAAHAERSQKVAELQAGNDALVNALARAEEENVPYRVTRLMDSVDFERKRNEQLAALLRTLRQWHGHSFSCAAIAPTEGGVSDMDACTCGWRELAAEVDAALPTQPDSDRRVPGIAGHPASAGERGA